MAQLDENNKFTSQTNLGWTFSFEANGKYPMIANRIFATKAGAEAYIADTTANATAIPGLILRVIEDTAANNGAYLVEEDLEAVSGLKLTKIVTGTLDISGKMVDIVKWNNQFYDATDVDHEHPIIDSQVDEEGKYLCLILNEDDDYVYIKSADLIDLTDYYTKEQVNDKINILDSSLTDYIDEQDASIKDYVDTETDKIDQRLDGVDTSIINITNQITNFVNTVEEQFDKIDSSLNNITADLEGVHETLDDIEERYDAAVERIDNIDSSIEELKSVDTSLDIKIEEVSTRLAELEIGTVDSISTKTPEYLMIDTSKGDVTIDINASTSTDPVNFKNTALVTNGYVDEKLAWIEIEEI